MVYTQNTPQASDAIATTQPLIEANFQFLQTGIGVEHNFNASGSGTDMYHLQASMPNNGLDPPALVSGTRGVYYVFNALPKYANASGANFLQMSKVPYTTLKGTVAVNNTGVFTVSAIPANSVGQFFIFVRGGSNQATSSSASGTLITDTNSMNIGTTSAFSPGITMSSSTLTLQMKYPGYISGTVTFTYLITYWSP
jgi:hypothetical protein